MKRRSTILLSLAVALIATAAAVHAQDPPRPLVIGGSGGLLFDDYAPTPFGSQPYLLGQGIGTQVGKCRLQIDLKAFPFYYYDSIVPMSFWLVELPYQRDNYSINGNLSDVAFDPITTVLTATVTFAGGVGRFQNATGSAVLTIAFDGWPYDPSTGYAPFFDFTIDGSISY